MTIDPARVPSRGTVFHLRNVYVLLGILVTSIGIVYFALEFVERLSEWGRVAGLALLGVMFVALGRHVEAGGEASEIVDARGWRWLRVTTALYVLGIVAAFATVITFLSIDELDPLWKLAATLVAGLGLIAWAARRHRGAPPT